MTAGTPPGAQRMLAGAPGPEARLAQLTLRTGNATLCGYDCGAVGVKARELLRGVVATASFGIDAAEICDGVGASVAGRHWIPSAAAGIC